LESSGYGESINHSDNITVLTDSYAVKVEWEYFTSLHFEQPRNLLEIIKLDMSKYSKLILIIKISKY
jgi:hypothetical protein